jgi:hypothetical protein
MSAFFCASGASDALQRKLKQQHEFKRLRQDRQAQEAIELSTLM